jgi:hypothetical protein
MKPFHRILMLGLVLLLIHSCLDYQVTTTIHPDGSLDRVVRIERADSGSFDTGSMLIPQGEGWILEAGWEKIYLEGEDSVSKYTMTAKKHFGSFEDLNRDLMKDSLNEGKIKISTGLKKKFRWFFTSYLFTETYKRYFPFDYYPMTDFLSEEEIAFNLNPEDFIYSPRENKFVKSSSMDTLPQLRLEDSIQAKQLEKDLEAKMIVWMSRNAWEEFSMIAFEALESMDPGLGLVFSERKDSLFKTGNLQQFLSPGDENVRETLSIVSRMLEIDENDFYAADSANFERFFNRFEHLLDPLTDRFKNTFIMPGKLTSSNAEVIEGNTCSWEIRFEEFFNDDYTMFAESMIIHTWAIVVSIFAMILALLAIIFSLRKGDS